MRVKYCTLAAASNYTDNGIEGDATSSAFCVEKSGLFITNAHVVTCRDGKVGRVWLVVECGLATQRILPAKVLRLDDENDLVLLQVNAGSDLTALELGQDAGLVELAEVTIFGYPFGRMPAVGRARYPDITILPSRITGLRRDKEGLAAIQFDSQLNVSIERPGLAFRWPVAPRPNPAREGGPWCDPEPGPAGAGFRQPADHD